MIHSIWNKIAQPFRDFGLSTGLLYLAQRTLARLPLGLNVVKYHLVAQPVPEPPRRRRPHTLVIRQVTLSEYQDHWFPRPRPAIEARFAQDAICFVAFSDDQALGCLWLKVGGDFIEDTVRCRFRPVPVEHTAWDFDVYVLPEHRLGRTFMHIWTHAFDWMRDREIHWTMSRIDAFNLPSINSHKRLGAQFTDSLVVWKWGSWQFSISGQTPRCVLSRSAVPTFTIESPEQQSPVPAARNQRKSMQQQP